MLGRTDSADALRNDFLTLARDTAFAEYVDPHTGQPHGATDFRWTVALTLDLIHR